MSAPYRPLGSGRAGKTWTVNRFIPLAMVTLALGCTSDDNADPDPTASTTAAPADDASANQRERRFLDLIGQSSGIATEEMLVQGYDLCATFAAQEDVSRGDLTLEWAAVHDVDPARARAIADAAGRELCP